MKTLPTIHPKLEIEIRKAELAATNQKVYDYMEGIISEEDYAPIKAERQAIRDRINELEAAIAEQEAAE